jgi:septal ring factor EnvC (AmiA/AmiB activator)
MNDSEYWAICHLKSYEKPFEYYNRILENQKQINEKIDEFVNNINSDNFQNSDKEKQLSGFEKSINKLNEMILDFQKSLKSVIDNSVVGLEGNCPIESQLQYRKKLKSMIFRRKKQNFQ